MKYAQRWFHISPFSLLLLPKNPPQANNDTALRFQCSALLNDEERMEFIEEIAEEYEDIRTEHYESILDRRYVSLKQSRESGQ